MFRGFVTFRGVRLKKRLIPSDSIGAMGLAKEDSLTIITQQDSGQMNHLAIVPAEKLFEYSNVTGGGQ